VDYVKTYLEDFQAQGVALDQVPCVTPQFPFDVVNDPRRPKEAEGSVPTQDGSEEVIKADEVVEVSMRHKDLAHPEEIARG
jgi:hypothetical protein